jgi:iron complex outermembrane receptor protein
MRLRSIFGRKWPSAVSVAVSMCVAASAQGQEPPAEADDVDTIVITGSNIRSGVGEQIARPVDVVSAEQLERLGPQKLVDALKEVPGFTGAANTAGSGTASNGRSTLNLRGLGEKYTLVLVNGRRFNAVSSTNINSIPASAVGSIEVLKDGSSSVYGSDAVAGVVNILLDNRFEGLELNGSYGNTFGHDASEIEAGLKFGAAGDRGRVMLNMSYRDRNGTALTDMALGRVANAVDIGGVLEERYYTNPAVVILPDGERMILDYNRFGPGEYSTDPADWIPYDQYDYNQSAYNLAERELYSDRAPETQAGVYAYGEYDLVPESLTAFSEILFSTGKERTTFVTWGLDFYGDPITDFGPVPATNPWNPFGIELRDVQYAVPEVGPYGNSYDTDTYRAVAGVKGRRNSLSYEIGATYFRSEETRQARNLYSSRGLLEAINRPGLDAFNPFCNACNTPEQMAGIRVPNNQFVRKATQSILDAKLTGPLMEGANSDLAFAVGAEYREEELDVSVDPLTLTGDVYYFQSSPDFQERSAKAAFGEIAWNLRGRDAGIPAVHKLIVELSGRAESIEGVGDTFNPRLAVAWQPWSDALTLRTSFGTSFNAPPIDLLRAEQELVNAVLFYPELGQSVPTDVLVGGNPELDPETAESLNFGLIFEPAALPGSSVSVDYFRIRQKDVVVVPDPQGIADGSIPGEVDFSGVRPRIDAVPTNVAGRNVDGLDVMARLKFDGGRAGTFGASLAGTYLTRFEVDNGTGAGFVDILGTLGQDGTPNSGTFGALPKFRGRAAASWEPRAGFETELAVNYVGSFEDNGVDREVEEFVTLDLTAGFDLGHWARGLSGNAGLLNVLDEEPPFVSYRYYDRYDSSTANSRGRYLFVSMKYAF